MVPFSGEIYLETKIWVLDMLTAARYLGRKGKIYLYLSIYAFLSISANYLSSIHLSIIHHLFIFLSISSFIYLSNHEFILIIYYSSLRPLGCLPCLPHSTLVFFSSQWVPWFWYNKFIHDNLYYAYSTLVFYLIKVNF